MLSSDRSSDGCSSDLNLRNDCARRDAAAALLPLGDGLLVEAMIEGAIAELILGVVNDPQYGLLLTLGAGGILTELLGDSRTLLLPVSRDEIAEALNGLRVARSEEHTSELQSLMRISYAVFCLKKKTKTITKYNT